MIEKRPPGLRWRPKPPDHVLGHSGLEDLYPYSMDPRSSQQQIGLTHTLDQAKDLWIDLWRSRAPALPTPVVSESLPMPADDSLGLNDMKALSPTGPNAR